MKRALNYKISIGSLFLFWVLLMLSAPVAASGGCVLKSWAGDEPPYLFNDARTGKFTGPDAEMLRTAAMAVGCSVEFMELPWKRALVALENGDIDVVPFAKFTSERAAFAHYSISYRDFVHRLFVAAENSTAPKGLRQLMEDGGRVGVMRGFRYPREVESVLQNPAYHEQIVSATEYSQLLRMLHKGRLGGVITSNDVLLSINSQFGIGVHFFKSLEEYHEKLHFLFSKKTVNEHQVAKMNQVLQIMVDSGDYEELY